jgi:hypothetical protein
MEDIPLRIGRLDANWQIKRISLDNLFSIGEKPRRIFRFFGVFVMPVKGLEPPLPLRKRILSPSRLPFRHFGAASRRLQDTPGHDCRQGSLFRWFQPTRCKRIDPYRAGVSRRLLIALLACREVDGDKDACRDRRQDSSEHEKRPHGKFARHDSRPPS